MKRGDGVGVFRERHHAQPARDFLDAERASRLGVSSIERIDMFGKSGGGLARKPDCLRDSARGRRSIRSQQNRLDRSEERSIRAFRGRLLVP